MSAYRYAEDGTPVFDPEEDAWRREQAAQRWSTDDWPPDDGLEPLERASLENDPGGDF